MAVMRSITVRGSKYLWKYTVDNDYIDASRLTVLAANRKGKLIVHFRPDNNSGYCLFNEGKPAVRNGEPVVINLNQPRFTAEIIAYVLDTLQIDLSSEHTELQDGMNMLRALGYEFLPVKRRSAFDE